MDEASMQDAIVKSKEKRLSLVTHLVAANLATARDIAISASNEFGVPLLDLDAVALMYCWLLLDVEQPTFAGSRSLLAPDGTRGWVPVPTSYQLRVIGAFSRHILKGMQRIGVETLIHFTTRDRNLMALQSELLGAYALGIRNVIALTGDPPQMGSYPSATGVWDVKAPGFIRIIKQLLIDRD